MLTNFHRFDEITSGLKSEAFTYSLMDLVDTLPFNSNNEFTIHGKTIKYTYTFDGHKFYPEDDHFTLFVDGVEVMCADKPSKHEKWMHEAVVEAHGILFDIITRKPEWLCKCTPIEQEFYWKLRGRQASHEIDYQRLYNLIKQFYAARKHMVVDREREISTYKSFLMHIALPFDVDPVTQVGRRTMSNKDICDEYAQYIYFGTLGL